jgi:hypothetical protein
MNAERRQLRGQTKDRELHNGDEMGISRCLNTPSLHHHVTRN